MVSAAHEYNHHHTLPTSLKYNYFHQTSAVVKLLGWLMRLAGNQTKELLTDKRPIKWPITIQPLSLPHSSPGQYEEHLASQVSQRNRRLAGGICKTQLKYPPSKDGKVPLDVQSKRSSYSTYFYSSTTQYLLECLHSSVSFSQNVPELNRPHDRVNGVIDSS